MWIKRNENPINNRVGDCVVRAISTALNQEWEKTYTELERLAEIHLPKSGLATELPVCIDRWLAHTHEIRNWCQWCVCKQELKALGLEKLVDEMVAKGWSGEVTSNRFLKGLYHQLALQAVDSDESLRMFNCLLFEEQISKYKQLAA